MSLFKDLILSPVRIVNSVLRHPFHVDLKANPSKCLLAMAEQRLHRCAELGYLLHTLRVLKILYNIEIELQMVPILMGKLLKIVFKLDRRI